MVHASSPRIPVCEPVLDGREEEYLLRAFRSGWISSAGEFLEAFEEKWAAYCGVRHGVACSNGTTALHLAFAALHPEPGDEIVMPSMTIVANGNMALLAGLRPVFADIDPATWCLDPASAKARITPRTKAILAVHMYGHPCDMDALQAIARPSGIPVIEDAAQAHGARWKGRPCGGIGRMAAFSFYANKILTTGEGGMLTTDDDAVAASARLLRNQAFTKPRFVHREIGFNYRLTNLQAAIGLAQVERIEAKVERKRAIARGYSERLVGLPLDLPVERPGATNVYWMYGVVLREEVRLPRDEVMARLETEGIETRAFFHPLHLQPAYERLAEDRIDRTAGCPVSERVGARGLYLPSGISLSDADLDRIADSIRRVVAR